MIYLLDTNVVSELGSETPSTDVQQWIRDHSRDELFISVATIGETAYGIQIMAEGKRKEKLRAWFEEDFLEWIGVKIYPIGESVMRDWAVLKAKSRPLPVVDSLLAATALAAGATLVTRNVKDFAGIDGLRVVNPWEKM